MKALNVYNPVEDHLRSGNEELGNEVIRLAKKHNVAMPFSLLYEHPVFARADVAMATARKILDSQPNIGSK